MKLMIVDDEKLLRSGFRHMTDWESKGIQIVGEAINGEDALNKLENIQPDVVLTDINMPVMNGIDLTKQIKAKYPHIIVIILSGYDDYKYIRESMKYGASDYLLKASIDVDGIYEMLHKLNISNNDAFLLNASTIGTDMEPILQFDKEKILNHLELQQFKNLKIYITEAVKRTSQKDIPLLQDSLRDLFFFIHFHLDRLNLLSKYFEKRKYINNSSVGLITDLAKAIEWISILIDEIEKSCETASPKHKDKIKKVIDIINKQYHEPKLTLSSIAQDLYVNKNYLCDIFKLETGTTINQYISDIRINSAKELIRKSQMTLNDISEKVGYSDYNYFSRVFKKKMGLTPSSYQKMYGK